MKRYAAFLIALTLVIALLGCDYYSDESISMTLPKAEDSGLTEYRAGVSSQKNAARLELLKYEMAALQDGQLRIELPETVKDSAGKAYAVDSFGGPIGPNAPLQKFELIIVVLEGGAEEFTLTVDAGSLPLDTEYWAAVQVNFLQDGTTVELPPEAVVFTGDAPLIYKLYLKEKRPDGGEFSAEDSDKWYEKPRQEYAAGETVVLKLKYPESGERTLAVTHEPVTVTECDAYLQYEFVMPHSDVRITIKDK